MLLVAVTGKGPSEKWNWISDLIEIKTVKIQSVFRDGNGSLWHKLLNYHLKEVLIEDHITPATEVYDRRQEFKNCGAWKLLLTVPQCLKGKNDKLKSQILGERHEVKSQVSLTAKRMSYRFQPQG